MPFPVIEATSPTPTTPPFLLEKDWQEERAACGLTATRTTQRCAKHSALGHFVRFLVDSVHGELENRALHSQTGDRHVGADGIASVIHRSSNNLGWQGGFLGLGGKQQSFNQSTAKSKRKPPRLRLAFVLPARGFFRLACSRVTGGLAAELSFESLQLTCPGQSNSEPRWHRIIAGVRFHPQARASKVRGQM